MTNLKAEKSATTRPTQRLSGHEIVPPNAERKRGEVLRVFPDKGFGFIEADQVEYFFHRSGFSSPEFFDAGLEGAIVEFAGFQTAKGWRAGDVTVVKKAE